MTRYLNVQSLLWIALLLAMASSLSHLASVFTLIGGSIIIGWLSAFAIDLGLVGLTASNRFKKNTKRQTRVIWAGILTYTLISVFENLSYALTTIDSSKLGFNADSRGNNFEGWQKRVR